MIKNFRGPATLAIAIALVACAAQAKPGGQKHSQAPGQCPPYDCSQKGKRFIVTRVIQPSAQTYQLILNQGITVLQDGRSSNVSGVQIDFFPESHPPLQHCDGSPAPREGYYQQGVFHFCEFVTSPGYTRDVAKLQNAIGGKSALQIDFDPRHDFIDKRFYKLTEKRNKK